MRDAGHGLREGATMNRRLIAALLAAGCWAVPLVPLPSGGARAQSVTRPATDLALSIGRGQLVTVAGRMSDVFVANEAVADVQVKSANQLYVFGKAGGETTIYASSASGEVLWSANVRVGGNLDSVDQMLGLAMPEARINVATMSGTVLLTGTVAEPEDAAEAERLVKAFVGEGTAVMSRLRTATPLQVNLQVRIAEVSRSLIRDIGVNLTSIDGSGGFQFGLGQGRAGFAPSFRPGSATGTGSNVTVIVPSLDDPTKFREVPGTAVSPSSLGSTLAGAGRLFGIDLLGALDLGETIGLVTTLSNPNLTALSGETADFLAGGEFPIPVSQGNDEVTIEYRQFGVSLSYTPTVLASGRISLRVRPEVSELSQQGAVTLNGFQVPALTIRRAETTVELGSGQSFMIAGLLSNTAQNMIRKAPGVGDIPILGTLFRSTNFRKGETELVIVVTPYLVKPVDANAIRLPTDGHQTPNEIQRLLGNFESDGRSGVVRPVPREMVAAAPPPGPGDAPPVAAENPAALPPALGAAAPEPGRK
jgi:pilus assembly protein CpaC